MEFLGEKQGTGIKVWVTITSKTELKIRDCEPPRNDESLLRPYSTINFFVFFWELQQSLY